MKKRLLVLIAAAVLIAGSVTAGEIYRWVDKNGTIVFSDSPPAYGSFKKQKVEDQVDNAINQTRDVDKKTGISESDKSAERLKIEIDYQKKVKSIRDYDAMREELETLRDKYQKKIDMVLNRGISGRTLSGEKDAAGEIRELKKQYENEVRAVRKLYGYY